MTTQQPTNNPGQGSPIHEWVEAYVLGALDDHERLQFEEHLLTCAQCEAEIDRLTEVVHAIPLALPATETPRAGVWSDLVARINQQPALSSSIPASTGIPVPSATPPPTNWYRALSIGSIATLALALVVVSAWANNLNNRLDDAEQNPVLEQSDGSSVFLYGMEAMCDTCEGNGRVGIDPADHMGMVVVWNMNPDDEHQVWCANDSGEKQMVTNLQINEDGGAMTTFALPDLNGGYTRMYIQKADGTVLYISELSQDDGAGGWDTPTP